MEPLKFGMSRGIKGNAVAAAVTARSSAVHCVPSSSHVMITGLTVTPSSVRAPVIINFSWTLSSTRYDSWVNPERPHDTSSTVHAVPPMSQTKIIGGGMADTGPLSRVEM